jgi:hypothetical protein
MAKTVKHQEKKSPIDWKVYLQRLKDLDLKIGTHKDTGHHHSAKKLQEQKDALLAEIDSIKKQRGI